MARPAHISSRGRQRSFSKKPVVNLHVKTGYGVTIGFSIRSCKPLPFFWTSALLPPVTVSFILVTPPRCSHLCLQVIATVSVVNPPFQIIFPSFRSQYTPTCPWSTHYLSFSTLAHFQSAAVLFQGNSGASPREQKRNGALLL